MGFALLSVSMSGPENNPEAQKFYNETSSIKKKLKGYKGKLREKKLLESIFEEQVVGLQKVIFALNEKRARYLRKSRGNPYRITMKDKDLRKYWLELNDPSYEPLNEPLSHLMRSVENYEYNQRLLLSMELDIIIPILEDIESILKEKYGAFEQDENPGT